MARIIAAIILNILVTITLALSFASPWWRARENQNPLYHVDSDSTKSIHPSNRDREYIYCFIDGTCKNIFPKDGNWNTFKNNGGAQIIYDLTLVLMLASLIPFLVYLHLFFCRRSKPHSELERDPKLRISMVVSGILTFSLILFSILVFSIGLPMKGKYDDLFGHDNSDSSNNLYNKWTIVTHEPFLGWFFAIVTLALLIPSIILSSVTKIRQDSAQISSRGKSVTYYS